MNRNLVSRDVLAWRKSSRCESSGCVEVAPMGQGIAIRDSKDANGPILMFSRDQWRVFLDAVRAGEFEVN